MCAAATWEEKGGRSSHRFPCTEMRGKRSGRDERQNDIAQVSRRARTGLSDLATAQTFSMGEAERKGERSFEAQREFHEARIQGASKERGC
jgi:hypothetical protein